MRINDSVLMDASGLKLTNDGFLVGDAKVSRAGNVQEYYGSELGLTGDAAAKRFGVYRDPDVVFDQESMMSLAGRPVTRNHPTEQVTADNWKELTVGQVGGVIKRDGEHVVAPMAIMDSQAVQEVLNGARSLSAGYTVEIVAADGVSEDGTPYQFKQAGKLRFNHVAYLPNNNPRAGNTRIGDSVDSQRSEKGGLQMPEVTKPVVVLGDAAIQVDDSAARVLEKFKADTSKQLSDAKSVADAAIAAKDAELAQLQAQLDDAKTKILSDADLDKRVAERAELVSVAAKISPDVKTSGMSDSAIRKAVVVAKLGDAAIAGKSDAYVDARFDILADATNTETNPVQVALSKGVTVNVGDAASAEAAALAKANDFNAWRNQ